MTPERGGHAGDMAVGAWQGAGVAGGAAAARASTRASSSTCWGVRGAARVRERVSSSGFMPTGETRTVFVRPGAKIDEIGSELVAQGLLRSPFAVSRSSPVSRARDRQSRPGQYTSTSANSCSRS